MTKSAKEEKTINIRELVLGILMEVLEQDNYSNVVIHNTLMKYQYLEKQDRAFLSRLSEGCVERYIELDYIIDSFSKVKVKKMKAPIRNILRMGVYQILYMNQVPDSAACNESVKLAQRKGFAALKGFVNGVLRNVSRNKERLLFPDKEKEPKKYLQVMYSCPEWIIDLWLEEYTLGEVEEALKNFMEAKTTTIRCNTSKISVEELKEKLVEEGITVEAGEYLPYALKIKDYNYLNRVAAFREGLFQVQDESSMLIAQAAGIKEGDTIIDVCAAPGGKTTHCAEFLKGTGKVISRDLTEYKVSLIEENVERLGLSNVTAKVQDALELCEEDVGKADIVIADLPCSGLGVIGKKADIKYKTKPEDVENLGKLQREILTVVSQYVKPGGVLIYSTCTVNGTENMDNRNWILENLDFEAESLDNYLPETLHEDTTKEGYLQLFPGKHKCDGFFVSRFRKKQ